MMIFDYLAMRKNPVKYWRKKGAKIGCFCEIQSHVTLGSEPYLITIGDHVRITHGTRFITHDGGVIVLRNMYPELQHADIVKPIRIGNNVHIGNNCFIMPGVTIGNNCIIGCGAIVTRDIPDNSIAAGVPARVIERIEEYKEKHTNDFLMTKNYTAGDKRKYLEGRFFNGEK